MRLAGSFVQTLTNFPRNDSHNRKQQKHNNGKLITNNDNTNEINNDINDYYDECDDYIDDFMNNSFLSKKSFSPSLMKYRSKIKKNF